MSQNNAEYVFGSNGFPEDIDIFATWLAVETHLADGDK
jgi:hypothetical protein